MDTISLTFHGNIDNDINLNEMIEKVGGIFAFCEKEITHLSFNLENKKSSKIKNFKKSKMLLQNLESKNLEYISFLSLPDDYNLAAFDYSVLVSINYKHKCITAVFDEKIMDVSKIETINKTLSVYMRDPYSKEIYMMSREETPLLYALKMNPSDSFKTLRIISRLDIENII